MRAQGPDRPAASPTPDDLPSRPRGRRVRRARLDVRRSSRTGYFFFSPFLSFSSISLSARSALLGAIVCAVVAAPAAAGSKATGLEVARLPDVPPTAFARDGLDDGEPRVSARLLVAPDPERDDKGWVGVLIELDPGWHTYWRNPGDTGLPTKLRWRLDGAEVGPTLWPTPTAFEEGDGLFTTFGYEGRVILQSEVRLDPDHVGPREVSVEAELLICLQECIPAEFSLRRSFDDALVNSPDADLGHALLARARAELPVRPEAMGLALEALYSQSGVRPGDALVLGLAVHACVEDEASCAPVSPARDVRFFPDEDLGLALTPAGHEARGARSLIARFDAEAESERAPGAPTRLAGVLRWRTEDGAEPGRDWAVEVDLPVPWQPAGAEVTLLGAHWSDANGSRPATEAAAARARAGGFGFAWAILLAFVGGLILNLMPCVLPVLAIKVFSVAELAERDRREVVGSGLAYTAGILVSMGVLAASVLALRAAGTAVGWGFQFQSPTFIAGVAMVLVAFALNLFGTWEIQWNGGRLADVGREAQGLRRSFFEGLLAVVLSTPCSAPFLGTAVGFAFAGSAFTIVAIFVAIGLGLAAPFLLVTLLPGAARVVPRSGAWMLKLRAGLGFALLATVVWLLWIVGQSAGVAGMTTLVGVLLLLSFGLFVYGALQQSGRGGWMHAAAAAVVVIVFAGLNTVAHDGRAARAATAPGGAAAAPDGADATGWRAFDAADIAASLGAGQPVFVAFSADWCITCKVNEQVVLSRDDVQTELVRAGFERFKADWTRRDETIRAELARHGRAGVPMYLVYTPGRPDAPEILPELLSPDGVIEAIRRAGADAARHRASSETRQASRDGTNRPSI